MTEIKLPHLPRAGSALIESIELGAETIAVVVVARAVDALDRHSERRRTIEIPRAQLPETGSVDDLEAALIAAIVAQLAGTPSDAAASPVAEPTSLDAALTRLAERRVVGLT